MALTIIEECTLICGYRDFIFMISVNHIQASVDCRDIVVVCIGIFIQCIGKCIFRNTCQDSGSTNGICCTFSLNKSIFGNRDFMICQRCTVIFFCIACRCHHNNAFFDCQISRNQVDDELVCDIIACIVFDNSCTVKGYRYTASIGCRCDSLYSFNRIELLIYCECILFDTGDCMFCSVIFECSAVCVDIDFKLVFTVVDCQRSVFCTNRVIVCVCVTVEAVCEVVWAVTDEGLCTCYIINSTFTIHKTVSCYFDIVVGQSCAIVFLCICCTGKNDFSWRDGQECFGNVQREFACYFITVCILDDRCACDNYRIGSCICCGYSCLNAGYRVCVSVDFKCQRLKSACCMRTAIIHCTSAVRSNIDGKCCLSACDSQCSCYNSDIIVGCLCSFIQCICECVCTASRNKLSSIDSICCTFTFCESISINCYFVIC